MGAAGGVAGRGGWGRLLSVRGAARRAGELCRLVKRRLHGSWGGHLISGDKLEGSEEPLEAIIQVAVEAGDSVEPFQGLEGANLQDHSGRQDAGEGRQRAAWGYEQRGELLLDLGRVQPLLNQG
jgi:hypothetical protein